MSVVTIHPKAWEQELASSLEDSLEDVSTDIAGEIEVRIASLRGDVAVNERAINELQKQMVIREAELQSDLAELSREIAERTAEIEREGEAREVALRAKMEANRSRSCAEIAIRSRLVASGHASLSALQEPAFGVLSVVS